MKFWFSRKIPAERKSLANPTPEEFALFGGGAVWPSAVSAATALTVPAVQTCIRLIAEAAASLEMRVERKNSEGFWEKDGDHPVAALLADRPNEWSSMFELVRDLVATALTNDKGALAWTNKVGGEVREIVRFEPAHYVIDYSTDGRLEPVFRINNLLTPADEIIHIRSAFSRCALSLASDAIGAAKAMEKHAAGLFTRGAKPGGVIETDKDVGNEAAMEMAIAWNSVHAGPDNGGKTGVLYDGAKFRQLVMNSTDAQFLENRKYQTLEICRAFRVPPSMAYEMDRATWANGEQQGKEFLTFTLEPWLALLESAFRRALFSAEERRTYRIKIDRDDLTRADLATRANAMSSLRASNFLSPNEGREWIDLPPYAGGDDRSNPHINQAPAAAAKPEAKP